ncbi:hypothetical protein [Flavobacterium flavigenum]|uniref:hypothetical protein n=1 Tax=Flavobacterium flavigenum TaxID=3003258 RepID=UPI00248273E2|nr:hypothetical protein [Flavobacterium flavigenum]
MKLKHYLFVSFLLIATSTIYSQNDKKLYEIIIFKWTKVENKDVMKVIKIDSLGNIFLSKQKTEKKVELKNFTKKINQFILEEKLEKVPGDNNPPRMSLIPAEGKQTIAISIVFLDDYRKETNLANNTYYSWTKTGLEINSEDYLIFKYLNKTDINTIKSLLK